LTEITKEYLHIKKDKSLIFDIIFYILFWNPSKLNSGIIFWKKRSFFKKGSA